MYSATTAKRLLSEQGKSMSDLAEFIFGDRKHSVKHLFVEGANPTAKVIEGMAEFFHVPMDVLFNRQVEAVNAEFNEAHQLALLVNGQKDELRLIAEQNEILKDYFNSLKQNSATK